MKKEIRVIGIDDSPFDKSSDTKVLVVGTIFRGGMWMDGVVSTHVTVDGTDATAKITRMVCNHRFLPQLQAILLDGIAVGGFNVIDIQRLSKLTRLPVVVVMRDMPNIVAMHSALQKIGMEKKIAILQKAGPIHTTPFGYAQIAGTTYSHATEILKITCTRSNIPEPLRAAHLICAGVVAGESKGKA